MRVLLIDNSPTMGGSIRSAAGLLTGLVARGAMPTLLASRPDLFRPLVPDSVVIRDTPEVLRNVFDPAHGLFDNPIPLVGSAWALWRFGRRIKPAIRNVIVAARPDIVHVNNLNLPNLPVVQAVAEAGTPVVLHARMIRAFGRRELGAIALAARVICISQAVRTCLLDANVALPERLVVVPNGVDTVSLAPTPTAPARAALGLPPDVPVVVLPGRLADWKGQHVAIAAWPAVRARHADAVLALVGDGEPAYVARLRQQAAPLGDAVHFLGHHADVGPVLAAADLVALTSCHDKAADGTVEAFGRVIIEAMAAGRPVVATHVGGVPELVVDGQTGLLAAPNDPADLAAKINAALDDPAWRQRAGAAGRAEAVAQFAQEVVTDRVLDVYRAVPTGAR